MKKNKKKNSVICVICFLTAIFFLSFLISFRNENYFLTISFPAYEFLENEYNKESFEEIKFKVEMTLPRRLKIHIPTFEDKEFLSGLSPVFIMEGKSIIGEIDYNTFSEEIIQYSGDNNVYRAIYNQLMLSNITSWDNEYQELNCNGKTHPAICQIITNNPVTKETTFSPGILAYNSDLCVYINISFNSKSITASEQEKIAESIIISPN